MKKFLLTLFLITSPCFAVENIKLKPDTDYLYFSENIIKTVKTSNPQIIKCDPITTYSGETSQILFSSLKEGNANIKIETEKGTLSFDVEVSAKSSEENEHFMEIDMPVLKSEN